MDKYDMASLSYKILSIYVVIQGINGIVSGLYSFITIFPFVILSAFGVLLWFYSDKISAFMYNGDSIHFGLKDIEFKTIAFSILGLSLIGNSIPRVVSLLTRIIGVAPNSSDKISFGEIGTITQLITGIAIFVGSHRLILSRKEQITIMTDYDAYEEQLIQVVKRRLGFLKKQEHYKLCKSIAYISRNLDNYAHSPEEMVSLLINYSVWARVNLQDIIGREQGVIQYFTTVYKW